MIKKIINAYKEAKVRKLSKQLNDKWQKLYGDGIHVGSGYGYPDSNYMNAKKACWFLMAQSDDKSILGKLPDEVNGFPVRKGPIARAYSL